MLRSRLDLHLDLRHLPPPTATISLRVLNPSLRRTVISLREYLVVFPFWHCWLYSWGATTCFGILLRSSLLWSSNHLSVLILRAFLFIVLNSSKSMSSLSPFDNLSFDSSNLVIDVDMVDAVWLGPHSATETSSI
jgi:hypothetical protein